MTGRDRIELGLLGAIWGASFLFMRVAAPEWGPVALIEVRLVVAAAMLLGILRARGQLSELRGHWPKLFVLGAINSAIPFSLYAYATLTLHAGFTSVLNATTPLFGALVGWVWLRERLSLRRCLGLLLGFAGVVLLVSPKLHGGGERLAILAGLSAALGYGISAHYTRRKLAGVAPLAIATGSLVAASLLLLPLAAIFWPKVWPSWQASAYAIVLGVLCTGVGYLFYFRLLSRLGAARTMTVTYLIPVFGFLWGAIFLREVVTWPVIAGGALILGGILIVLRSPSLPAKPGAGT